jgi:hypothetical protein
MDQGYVKEMERLANEGRVIDIGEETFSSLNMKPVFYEPRPEALTVRTLTGLYSYIDENIDDIDRNTIIVQVVDHKSVSVVSKISGKDRKRDSYINAKHDGAMFKFGEFMASEPFLIAVNALFLPTKGRDELLAYASSLKVESEANITDTGVSQEATVRQGIKGGLTKSEPAPARVVLKPFRTFTEIDQPESEFVFRMRRSESGVDLALFEADGGAWKSEAMLRISAWLSEKIPGLPVIA